MYTLTRQRMLSGMLKTAVDRYHVNHSPMTDASKPASDGSLHHAVSGRLAGTPGVMVSMDPQSDAQSRSVGNSSPLRYAWMHACGHVASTGAPTAKPCPQNCHPMTMKMARSCAWIAPKMSRAEPWMSAP